MIKRIITGLILVACLVGVFFLREVTPYCFDALLFIILIASMYELYCAFSKIEVKCNLWCLWISAVSFGLGCYLIPMPMAFIISVAITLVWFTFSKNGDIRVLLATIFAMVYPSALLYYGLVLNHLQAGLVLILLVFLVAILTDTFAYFVGSAIKGPKLCPTISPKKTVSGAIGGIVGGILGALLLYFCFEVWQLFGITHSIATLGISNSVWIYLAIGLIGGILDEIGDLVSSQIKRKTGIKDFGNIFPGHGGVLDRIDGISFVMAGVGIFVQILFLIS